MRNTLLALATGVLLALPAAAQKEQYLDLFVVHVKPDKRAEFDALNKRVAEANRKNNGDMWLAMGTEYGENNTVTFISARANYAGIDQGSTAFMGALHKAFGEAMAKKMMAEFNSYISSSRGEIRRRRPDLSMNVPSDTAAWRHFIGEQRFVRTIAVRVRPGREPEYEAQLLQIKQAVESGEHKIPVLVSQNVAGVHGSVYYISLYGDKMGSFDGLPTLLELLGDERFQSFMKTEAEAVLDDETTIYRYLPELSNAPQEIAAAAPEFWHPKPVMATTKKHAGAKPAGTP
jgi:quinol monooxygenase YgiN